MLISIFILRATDSTLKIGFLLSPAYKHLKGIFAYTKEGKDTQLKKTCNA